MKRRDLLAGLLPVAVAPLARAQQPEMPVVGLLSTTSAEYFVRNVGPLSALHAGLKERGYVEGRNVAFAYRWAEGDYARLPTLATELVALKVAVIVGAGTAATLAARNATRTVPIVFSVNDPVELGLVASYNRPGGNATGVDNLLDLYPKQLGLLREMLPNARSVGFIRFGRQDIEYRDRNLSQPVRRRSGEAGAVEINRNAGCGILESIAIEH
jgi:putative ABC transport system substrate-binding protein